MSSFKAVILVSSSLLLTGPQAKAIGDLESIYEEGDSSSTWYVAPQMRHTWLYGSDTLMVGIRGAWSIDQNWAIGAEVSSAINALFYANTDPRSQDRLLYYGGYLERSFFTDSTFNGALSTFVGGGLTQYETFLALEPRLDLRVELSRYVRIGWGASYRLTRTLQANTFSTADLGGLSTQLFVQLGNLP